MITKEKIYCSELERDMFIYKRLPDSFDKSKQYNILYMHDGQNLFYKEDSSFGHTWEVDETLSKMESNGYPETIVIGFSSSHFAKGMDRLREYSYCDNTKFVYLVKESCDEEESEYVLTNDTLKARGRLYEQFILSYIASFEEEYNINERMMMGSSMGGLYTLMFAMRNENVIDKAYCVSNAFHYCLESVIDNCKKISSKIYIDTGTHESSQGDADSLVYVNMNTEVYLKVKELGNDVVFKTYEGAIHNEKDWAKRFSSILNSI